MKRNQLSLLQLEMANTFVINISTKINAGIKLKSNN